MSRIGICHLPLQGSSHSMLAFARRLREHGHSVVFFGMKDGEALVSPAGFRFVSVFEEWFPSGYAARWVSQGRGFWTESRDHVRNAWQQKRFLGDLSRSGVAEFSQRIVPERFDLILISAGLLPEWPLLCYHTGIPCLYLSEMFPWTWERGIPPLQSRRQAGESATRKAALDLLWLWFLGAQRSKSLFFEISGFGFDYVKQIRKLSRSLGHSEDLFDFNVSILPLIRDLPFLVMGPKELDFPFRSPTIHYIESCVDEQRDPVRAPFPWDGLNPAKKQVYVSLGSISFDRRFYQEAIDAIGGERAWQLILVTSDKLSAKDFRDVPDDAILVPWAPQTALLSRVDAVVSHAGSNTLRECLSFGIPVAAYPIGGDQFGNAARLEYHGLGLAGNIRTATASQLRLNVRKVLHDPAIRRRCQQVAASMQTRNREAPGIRLVESSIPRAKSN